MAVLNIIKTIWISNEYNQNHLKCQQVEAMAEFVLICFLFPEKTLKLTLSFTFVFPWKKKNNKIAGPLFIVAFCF